MIPGNLLSAFEGLGAGPAATRQLPALEDIERALSSVFIKCAGGQGVAIVA